MYEPGGMSEDEEDQLDMLLHGDLVDDMLDGDEDFVLPQHCSQSTEESSQESASSDPFAKPNLYWQDDDVPDNNVRDPRTTPFKPSRQPGVQFGQLLTRNKAKVLKGPGDFLKLFLTEAFLLSICIATNAYAESLIGQGQNKSYAVGGEWARINVEELRQFIGIIIYMSVVKYQKLDRYWSTDNLYANNPVPKVMSRTRFQAILSFIQVTPPADLDNKDEKLRRISPMIDHVRQLSKEFYQPRRDVAVDERMVASKHQYSGIRQFIKDKPCRFGFKLWVLACNSTGYTFDFFVYLGKKRATFEDKSKGIGYNVAYTLCKPLFGQGYKLFTDCFYTSLTLGKALFLEKVYIIGVIKSNSTSMPDEFKDWKEWEKCVSRGDFRWHRNDNFLFVQWKDTKTVTFMSPLHCGSSTTTCERTVKSRVTWSKKALVQPQVANDYNKCMGAVDLSNQYLNKYPSYIRTQYHWWKVLFFHMIDICIVNSYILYQEFMSYKNVPSECPGQFEYREALATLLMDVNNDKPDASLCLPEFLEQRYDCVYCNAKAILEGKKTPSYKTYVCCRSCQVSLCLTKERNCFRLWHLPEGSDVKHCAQQSCKKRKCFE